MTSSSAVPPVLGSARAGRIRFGWLAALALIGLLAVMPHTLHYGRQFVAKALEPYMNQRGAAEVEHWVWVGVVSLTVFLDLAVSAGAIVVGLWASRRTGLSQDFVVHGGSHWSRPLLRAGVLGFVAGWVILFAMLLFPTPEIRDVKLASPALGVMAAVGAGIREELWCRFALMSALLAGLSALRSRPTTPGDHWLAIGGAALVFGLLHVPQGFGMGIATGWVITATLLLNGVIGTLCGWLYWRCGLLAAMTAHVAMDLVLHGAGPLFRSAEIGR